MVDDGLKVVPLIEDVTELRLSFFEGNSGVSRDTIFIPTPSPVLAGMKSVVTPFLLMTDLCGW